MPVLHGDEWAFHEQQEAISAAQPDAAFNQSVKQFSDGGGWYWVLLGLSLAVGFIPFRRARHR